MRKILITPRSLTKSGHPELDKLVRAGYELVFSSPGGMPDEDELINLIDDCSGYLAGIEKITRKVIESAKKLKVISRNGVGIDNIDVGAAEDHGVKVCVAKGANARGVAELTMGLLLSLVRSIPFHNFALKEERWERKKGIEIKNKTLGVIGCGKIGREVSIMALNLGMNVLAYDIYINKNFKPDKNFKYKSFEEVIRGSDILTFHLPGSKDGRPIITDKEIKGMKRGVFIINTARANLIDMSAIIKGLEEKIISGYATDVYLNEPPSGVELELLKRKDVIATPHIGGYTEESIDRATREAVENLLKYLS
ncbi:MAG: oxidoreductase [Spirochaetes bacterium]|nr:MAG: oxidoreductase [Spirochaetota bacterium]